MNSGKYFNREGKEISPEEWMRTLKPENQRVGADTVENLWVSTVWLGMNHNWGQGEPLIFETMVFPDHGYSEVYCERYSTEEEAKAGHKNVVDQLKKGTLPEELERLK